MNMKQNALLTRSIIFYFFLEDLLGSGKSKNRAVIKSFQQSESLRNAIQFTIDVNSNSLGPIRNQELRKMFDDRSLSIGVDEVAEAIVLMRGNFHHSSQKSSKKKAVVCKYRDHKIDVSWANVTFSARLGLTGCFCLRTMMSS